MMVDGRVSGEQVVDLACDVALEATDDVLLGSTCDGSALDVLDGWRVPAHSDDNDPIERRVGLAVPAAEQAMPAVRLPGTGRDGTYAAHLGECWF